MNEEFERIKFGTDCYCLELLIREVINKFPASSRMVAAVFITILKENMNSESDPRRATEQVIALLKREDEE